ncbi:hypothetical protein [Algoriphagus sp. AK58]|uniref:hypothetical protein n=1 Tax=Algoriphagus sp. AK58 TaxID=1406877 RepID=UPI0016505916|nr:hypothetical protein [Algoriphagus sp. AK58]MBC6365747.1 hypothetical protein [Algoriphagus sp. AK58]
MSTLDEIKYRAQAPTPPFFQKLKRVGFMVAAVGTAVLTAPGELPEILLTWAQHCLTGGIVLITVSQLVVDQDYSKLKMLS